MLDSDSDDVSHVSHMSAIRAPTLVLATHARSAGQRQTSSDRLETVSQYCGRRTRPLLVPCGREEYRVSASSFMKCAFASDHTCRSLMHIQRCVLSLQVVALSLRRSPSRSPAQRSDSATGLRGFALRCRRRCAPKHSGRCSRQLEPHAYTIASTRRPSTVLPLSDLLKSIHSYVIRVHGAFPKI